jgi:chromate transport protein ChrA
VGLNTIRYIVPAILVIVGFVILFTAGESLRWEGWAMCVGAGLAVLLLNVLYRYGATGDQERQDEDDAREYFGKHGRWPDDDAHHNGN